PALPPHLSLPSLPPRRSSDLPRARGPAGTATRDRLDRRPPSRHVARRRFWRQRVHTSSVDRSRAGHAPVIRRLRELIGAVSFHRDRKSTRLNSSHRTISYAVF